MCRESISLEKVTSAPVGGGTSPLLTESLTFRLMSATTRKGVGEISTGAGLLKGLAFGQEQGFDSRGRRKAELAAGEDGGQAKEQGNEVFTVSVRFLEVVDARGLCRTPLPAVNFKHGMEHGTARRTRCWTQLENCSRLDRRSVFREIAASSELAQCLFNPRQRLLFSDHFQQMIQARAVGMAGDGEARRVDEHANFHAEFGRGGF